MTNETKQPTLPEAIALVKEVFEVEQQFGCCAFFVEKREKALVALDSLQVGEPVTDHIEGVRGMVPVAWMITTPVGQKFLRLDEPRHVNGWQKIALYTQPADCPRCAELSKSINNRAREQAQKTENNGVCLDKLATLEAELSGLRARYLRMESEYAATIAQQAEQLAAAEKLLIECRSSVRLDWQNYERLLMNNNLTGSREAITDEAKRLHELLLAIDAAIAAQKGEK